MSESISKLPGSQKGGRIIAWVKEIFAFIFICSLEETVRCQQAWIGKSLDFSSDSTAHNTAR